MYKQINIDTFHDNKEKLQLFANMSEFDIKNVWKTNSDKDINDCVNIPYSYDLPLYAKMIIRFQNANKSPNCLHRQIDPHNQLLLRAKYDLYYDENLIEFFATIDDNLGACDIIELDDETNIIADSDYVKKWRNSSIKFFYWLSVDKQKMLVDNYNKKISEWNNSI